MDLRPGPEQLHVLEVSRTELTPIRHALQENEDWYQDLVEHSHDLLCIHDLAGQLLAINPAPARVLGYSVEELLRIPMRELVPPKSRAQFDAYLVEIARVGEARGLLPVMTRTGERRIWEYYNTLRTEGVASPIVRGIAHDVTEKISAEKRLREAGELNRQIVSSTGEGVVVFDRNLRCLVWNPFMVEMTGTPASLALGKPYQELVPRGMKWHGPGVELTLALQGETVTLPDEQLFGSSNHPRWISGRKGPLRNAQGEITGVIVTLQDVTARKNAEAQLAASEDRYRAVHERSPVGICWIESGSGRFLGVNPKYCEIVGRTEQDLLGRDFQSITHPDDLIENCEKLQQLVHGELQQYGMEKRYIRPDGSIRRAEVSVVTMSPERDKPIWNLAIVQDITERKQAEERLREYERVVEGLEEMIVVVDREYRYVIANQAFLNYRGMTKEQVVGKRVDEVVHKEVFDGLIREKMEECFRGKVVAYHLRYMYPRHGERELFATYFPIEGPAGVERIAAILQDVTESKRAEAAVKKSEEKFSKAFRQSPMAITLTSIKDNRYIEVNETFERATGWSREEVLGRTPFDIGLWANPAERMALGARLLSEGTLRNVETNFRMKDGRLRAVLITAEIIEVDGEPCVIGVAADITERKQAEEALRRSEENYRMFVSRSSEGIYREDMDAPIPIDLPEDDLIRHILYDSYMAECNDAQAAMYGLKSGQEFVGKRLTEMLPPDDPRNIELTRDYIRSGFRVLDRASHEFDIHGNPKVFLNSMIGIVEDGKLVRTWGIQRDITEKVKLEESRRQAEEALRENVAQLRAVTEELRLAKEKLSEEKLYLEQTIDTELGFGEIIGRSGTLQDVMGKVGKVAPSNATVLLLGETGTGKELVARAIHRLSKRKDNSFIKVNCAAIPSGLLESELFGHEKGAFTGAVARKVGRLELADHGTLFLDEIGEIPLDLQPKLLRVLQDQEFERLGGTQTLKVDFRLVAATNRDLLDSVNRREFRSDLYYRLNVFPLRIPPLRERREDIPLLLEHFVRKYASRMNKSILTIPAKTMETLVRWSWPGNIRELENFVERSVILTPGLVLQVPLGELHAEPDPDESVTLHDKERERILRALRQCHGQLGGPHGAAARLGLKRTTLQSRLNQFGINPGGYRD